jgi:hypothetical protein
MQGSGSVQKANAQTTKTESTFGRQHRMAVNAYVRTRGEGVINESEHTGARDRK